MSENTIRIIFKASDAAGNSDMTAAELGALMIGVSRSINKAFSRSRSESDPDREMTRKTLSYEPTMIGLKIVSLKEGSVDLDAVVTLLPSVATFQTAGKDLAIGILSNAFYDRYGRQILLYDFGRAVRRISRGALGKTFSLVIHLANRTISFHATVSHEGKVEVRTNPFPKDDVQ